MRAKDVAMEDDTDVNVPLPLSQGPSTRRRTCRLSVVGCAFEGTHEELEQHETLESHMNFILSYTERANGSIRTVQEALAESHQEKLELQSGFNAIKEQMNLVLREHQVLKDQVRLLTSKLNEEQRHWQRISRAVDVQLEEAISRSWTQGKFMWRIHPYSRLKLQQQNEDIARVVSPAFYTGVPGYKLRLMADLNGYGEGRGSHLSLFLQIMQGKFDSVMDWPCKNEHMLRVVDQSARGMHYDKLQLFRNIPSKNKHIMGRPFEECNVPIGFHTMIGLQDLENERNGYLRNDTVIIMYRCKI